MACKFHAVMRNPRLFSLVRAAGLCLALGAAACAPALAAKADRSKPLTIEADQPGTIDLIKQVVVFNGNVVIQQGTLEIRADRVEVRELPDGFRVAVALGGRAGPATFRQRREGSGEHIEGSADRIEYDGRADTLRFVGHAAMRRVRDGAVADEITGGLITYDNTSEVFSVAGAPPGETGGRVRAVLTPPPAASAPPPGSAR
jgi:lipopolysaccharide export system protein LptA